MSVKAEPRRFRIRMLEPVVSMLVFAVIMWTTIDVLGGDQSVSTGRLVLACLAGGTAYVLSHAMRAVRLAVIAMPLLGISFRTTVLLHFFVAPWSLVMPLKLDELIRLNELRRAGRSLSRAIVTLMIDRSMDGIVLVAVSLLLMRFGYSRSGAVIGMLGAGLLLIVLAFFTLPVLLEPVQRYIFMNHYRDEALYLLRAVSKARELLVVSRIAIGSAAPFLIVTTISIWVVEIGAVAILCKLVGLSPALLGSIEIAFRRANQGWHVLLGEPSGRDIAVLTVTFFFCLVVVWAVARMPYERRLSREPRRPRLPDATGFSMVSTPKGP